MRHERGGTKSRIMESPASWSKHSASRKGSKESRPAKLRSKWPIRNPAVPDDFKHDSHKCGPCRRGLFLSFWTTRSCWASPGRPLVGVEWRRCSLPARRFCRSSNLDCDYRKGAAMRHWSHQLPSGKSSKTRRGQSCRCTLYLFWDAGRRRAARVEAVMWSIYSLHISLGRRTRSPFRPRMRTFLSAATNYTGAELLLILVAALLCFAHSRWNIY